MSTYRPSVLQTQIDYNTGTFNHGTGWAQGPIFRVMTGFTAGTKLRIYLYIPGRNDQGDWGGGYVEMQVSINGGAWVSYGSSGYDGGVMMNGAADIGKYSNSYLINPSQTSNYTVQVRTVCKSYQSTYIINGSNNINAVSGTAPWYPDNDLLYQNYAHVIVEELQDTL